jgi:glyoxylase-like metal-dependent hydrolase (beta-lactamase superfamily II)
VLTLARTAELHEDLVQVAPDVACLQVLIVNLYLVGDPKDSRRSWVLVDTGVPYSSGWIRDAARQRFGPDARPQAIVLTHGHFDHVGAVRELSEEWDVPVYAHELELPFLTGRSDYPPPDPTVGGGLMARMAGLYPHKSINLGSRVQALPADGTIPNMPGWQWVHTPGHTPGHVSLFREQDRLLLAGDAFITTRQESALAVLTQYAKVHGPPAYFTPDWEAARLSVRRLAALRPMVAATGHGMPMRGDRLERELEALAHDFDEVAIPRRGRYVHRPAVADSTGVVYVPPPVGNPMRKLLAGLALAVGAVAIIDAMRRDTRCGGY